MKVSVALPPFVMVVGENALLKVGDAAAFTVMFPETPVRLFGVSVAVMVWVPGVCKLALNVLVPFTSVELAGSPASASVELKLTVPL